MKKAIILVSVMMMGLVLFGCGNKEDSNSDKESKKNDNNEYVIINGKTYDLSKDGGEALQEFVDDMYIEKCNFEDEDQPIREMRSEEKYDKDTGVYIYENIYFQLDKDGNYVKTDQKDFDERVMMLLSSSMNSSGIPGQSSIEEICSFRLETMANLNRTDIEVIAPGGVGMGSTTKELENAGAYNHYSFRDYYRLIYLDGELVNFDDYIEDAERIQKLEDSEWTQEREKEYKYQGLAKEYISTFNKAEEILGTKGMAFMLAYSDATAKIASGEKETMLIFDFRVEDDKVYTMGIEVLRAHELWKKSYEEFVKNK